MGDLDCGNCDCGDCNCDCGNCNCDCGDCCEGLCDCCPSKCCDCDCDGCCCFTSAFTCGHCCSDFLELVCCENTCGYSDTTDRANQQRNGYNYQQQQQLRQQYQQQHLQQPPFHEPSGEFKPDYPSAPPPSYDEVVLSQPMPNGFEPAITTQPGYDVDPPNSRI
ncbi:hypothetical protein EGW08_015570 [Elysia chlorotica]|uniref:Uncharacterized protein n=1 Tax=Elysia chlorotica TaxID=188477 RepID=A0A433T537_ELYCH|nr:hypothetical protein EGW08_015570 [Elysia chlorotica]